MVTYEGPTEGASILVAATSTGTSSPGSRPRSRRRSEPSITRSARRSDGWGQPAPAAQPRLDREGEQLGDVDAEDLLATAAAQSQQLCVGKDDGPVVPNDHHPLGQTLSDEDRRKPSEPASAVSAASSGLSAPEPIASRVAGQSRGEEVTKQARQLMETLELLRVEVRQPRVDHAEHADRLVVPAHRDGDARPGARRDFRRLDGLGRVEGSSADAGPGARDTPGQGRGRCAPRGRRRSWRSTG